MPENETTKNASDVILAVIYVSILVCVLLLAVVIIINSISTANTNLNGVTLNLSSVSGEIGYANSSGYTLSTSTLYGFTEPSLTSVYNRTNVTPISIALGNFTLTNAGVLNSSTSIVWDNLSISYTYYHDVTNVTGLDLGLNGIRDNTVDMVANFFALMPTVGTILAVIILIGGIVVLVFYVRKMKDGGNSDTFSG
jgi:hypothetical protein